MKNLFLLFLVISIISCQQNSPSPSTGNSVAPTATPTSTNPLVGSWVQYGYYEIRIKQNGTICSNQVSPATYGTVLTFNAAGTYTGMPNGILTGTYTFNGASGKVTRAIWSGSTEPEEIFYNNAQVPWSTVLTPIGVQNPTLYFNYDGSLGLTNGPTSCDFQIFKQFRYRKL